MIHRHCQTRIDTLEAEVRAADRRATDALAETARQRADAESASAARWDAAGEVEHLRDRLSAAHTRMYELECQVNSLEQDREDHERVLAARRRRVAGAALGDATRYPWQEQSAHQAAVAAALLALPLEHYDVEVTYADRRWRVDGELVADRHDDERFIREKYGITQDELRTIRTRTPVAA